MVDDHRWKKKDPSLEADLNSLIEPHLGGDPEGKRILVRKSRRSLVKMLSGDQNATDRPQPSKDASPAPAEPNSESDISTEATPVSLPLDTANSPESAKFATEPLPDESLPVVATQVAAGAAGGSLDGNRLELTADPVSAAEAPTAAEVSAAAGHLVAAPPAHSQPSTGSPQPSERRDEPAARRRASPNTIARLLKKLKISLRSNVKRLIGKSHPDRDKQYRYIQAVRRLFHRRGAPTLSIDAKKSELIGNFKNPGQVYCHKPESVNTYDFRSEADYRATAYGMYDAAANHALVVVGISVITGMFAVASIHRWWKQIGSQRYPEAKTLMLEADGGGCNGHRLRLWKWELQKLADETGLSIMVCHYPPGASKWNPIEHRVFGRITNNWAGEVLRSLDKMLALIRGSRTETGLVIEAELDSQTYEKGIKITDKQMKNLNLHRRKICPQWNYTIKPRISGSNS